ncbi:MAG: TerB family tellurite resistance protein [Gammaproteobacteria bacterium]|nr:TerB family tellurite resistance protein [Gammaproteobacteria bacterium]
MSDTIITYKLDGESLIVESKYGSETYDAQFLVAALLIYVARGSGSIEPEESSEMLALIHEHFNLPAAESLELLTRAMSELAEKPELPHLLAELGQSLSETEKEDIAFMALKVIAADGRREVEEMERFNEVLAAIDTPAHIVHQAFDRYFAETMPGEQ